MEGDHGQNQGHNNNDDNLYPLTIKELPKQLYYEGSENIVERENQLDYDGSDWDDDESNSESENNDDKLNSQSCETDEH